MPEDNFDLIRPYTDAEMREAIPRIINDPGFAPMMNYLFDEESIERITNDLRNVKTINEFQKKFTLPCIKTIVSKTSEATFCTGLNQIKPEKKYLFIANHRDIALDSSILGMHMIENGIKPPSIAWGSNLELSQFIVDLGKSNQMITVFRDGSPKEILRNSQRLSLYINKMIGSAERSVWIAQSKGRTKNGRDHVDASILKMLVLSGDKNIKTAFKNLNIIPVTISYELEPCGALKTREVYMSQYGKYQKEENEDLHSILGGFVMSKGRIHLDIGRPINDFIDDIDENLSNNAFIAKVAEIIDYETHANYRLWPTNYLAYDILEKSNRFANEYDEKTHKALQNRVEQLFELISDDKETLRNMFYKMYANPVYSKIKIGVL